MPGLPKLLQEEGQILPDQALPEERVLLPVPELTKPSQTLPLDQRLNQKRAEMLTPQEEAPVLLDQEVPQTFTQLQAAWPPKLLRALTLQKEPGIPTELRLLPAPAFPKLLKLVLVPEERIFPDPEILRGLTLLPVPDQATPQVLRPNKQSQETLRPQEEVPVPRDQGILLRVPAVRIPRIKIAGREKIWEKEARVQTMKIR